MRKHIKRPGAGIGCHLRDATHCIHGHEFTPENTIVYQSGSRKGRRACRACHQAAYHLRKIADPDGLKEWSKRGTHRKNIKNLQRLIDSGKYVSKCGNRVTFRKDHISLDYELEFGGDFYEITASFYPSPLEELIAKEEWEEEQKYHDWERRWKEPTTIYLYRPINEVTRTERHQTLGAI